MPKTKAAVQRPVEVDKIINRYATMKPAEVDKALEEAGIDPQPTIDAIGRLMKEKLAGRHR